MGAWIGDENGLARKFAGGGGRGPNFSAAIAAVNGAMAGKQPLVNLSYTEQLTGRLDTDGRPIYQKTVACGALPNASSKGIPHNVANINRIVCLYGYATFPGNVVYLPFLNVATFNSSFGVTCDRSQVTLITGTDRTSYVTSEVTIQYTKSTDTPIGD